MAHFIHKKIVSFLSAVIVCGLIIALGGPLAVQAQGDDLIRTNSLESRLKQKFKLTHRDTTVLHPLIKLENEKVILTYEHYSNDESMDFLRLWDSIRDGRRDFEANFRHGLTSRQKKALGFARTEFESRILNLWVEDYIGILAEILVLDRLQVSSVSNIFEREREKRHRLIINEARKLIQMNLEWQKLTEKREQDLEIILDPDQMREYRMLGWPAEALIAAANYLFRRLHFSDMRHTNIDPDSTFDAGLRNQLSKAEK